jgi:hypothetical protein
MSNLLLIEIPEKNKNTKLKQLELLMQALKHGY